MTEWDYDFLVIGGGGSAGFTAATTAMRGGARVGMVEAGRLGGLCILAGCMPSKTLLHSAAARLAAGQRDIAAHGGIMDRKRQVVEFLAGKRVEAVQAKQAKGLSLLQGAASFKDEHTLEVDGQPVSAAKLMIATGSRESVPSLPGLEQAGYLTSHSFLESDQLPESLVVLGGGAIALELAQYALRMGVHTTIIQRSGHLLSSEAPEVGQVLEQALAQEGAAVFTGTELEGIEAGPQGKTVRFQHQGRPTQVTAQEILLALGRRPNSEGLNLEAAGVQTQRGAVKVDQYMRTSQGHIFAGGDVTGVNMVVNLAIVQGQTAGYNATHKQMRPLNDRVVPRAVFTEPQFARVGLNQAEAKQAGIEFLEASYPLEGMGVSRTYPSKLMGFMTMRAAKADGRILGAELVGPEASLMIHQVAVAMQLEGRPRDMADIPYIHPCLAEVVQFCAEKLARKLAG